MKKLLFGLIATIMLSVSSFSQSYSNLKPEEYGKIHNEIVDLFEKSGKDFSQYIDYKTFLVDLKNLVDNKYPNLVTNENINELYSKFVKDISKPDFNVNFKENLERLYSKKTISTELYQGMKKIMESNSFNEKILIINSLKKLNLTQTELNSLIVYDSILHSSQQYWETARVTREDQIIAADALGGFIWFYTGPWAVLAAGAYSIAVAHSLP